MAGEADGGHSVPSRTGSGDDHSARIPRGLMNIPPGTQSGPSISHGRRVRAELAMALGGFGIGTGEFVIMGLLPDVARHTNVSIPEAGHAISAYALGVVVGAPVIAVLAARC